jgi:hypothetical protein
MRSEKAGLTSAIRNLVYFSVLERPSQKSLPSSLFQREEIFLLEFDES